VAVGAGGATTLGENGFGAPGSRRGAFSVGSTGAAGDGVVVVVVVVVVEVSGAFSSSLAHDAVKAPIAAIAPIAATVEIRRSKRF
jgi:hypothetical protein